MVGAGAQGRDLHHVCAVGHESRRTLQDGIFYAGARKVPQTAPESAENGPVPAAISAMADMVTRWESESLQGKQKSSLTGGGPLCQTAFLFFSFRREISITRFSNMHNSMPSLRAPWARIRPG